MKTCTKCLKELCETKFSKKTSSKDGLDTRCKSCRSAYNKEYRARISIKEKIPFNSRVCSKCGDVKGYDHFHNDKSKASGRSNTCKDCAKKVTSKWRKDNYQRSVAVVSEWRCRNKDRVKSYRESNKAYFSRKSAERRARELDASPNWLTEEHKSQISSIYEHARDCFLVSGQEYHVDHIVPLCGKNICGLHVPWNLQILPADVNQRKSNRLTDVSDKG